MRVKGWIPSSHCMSEKGTKANLGIQGRVKDLNRTDIT